MNRSVVWRVTALLLVVLSFAACVPYSSQDFQTSQPSVNTGGVESGSPKIVIRVNKVTSPYPDMINVVGEVYNNGSTAFPKSWLTLQCFDKDNRIIGTQPVMTDYAIEPGDTTSFNSDLNANAQDVVKCGARLG